ncbi:MAG: arginine beta-hydroxylase, Fe(II)/alpha-ketoglutarate-dependent [Actinocatenispora sp.]
MSVTHGADERCLVLTEAENASIGDLAQALVAEYGSADEDRFLADLPLQSARLPRRVWRFLRDFTQTEERGYCVVRNNPVDDDRIGPTPAHWQGRLRPNREQAEEVVLLLYAGVLGEPFAWRTQQDGRVIHDVLPIAGHEHEQLGTGSEEVITWHTEDAFHPFRGDYLLLGALRNHERAATTVSELDVSLLSDEDLDTLFEPRFRILPDNSHLPQHNAETAGHTRESFELITRMRDDPTPVPILYGSRSAPYLCLDPYFMPEIVADEPARRALANLVAALDKTLGDLVLAAGDYLVVNNHRAVHGRRPFKARFDGSDRWLKRMNVTNDLRRSRVLRPSPGSRVIG